MVIKVKVVFFIQDYGNQIFFQIFAENLSIFAKVLRKSHKIQILGVSTRVHMVETFMGL